MPPESLLESGGSAAPAAAAVVDPVAPVVDPAAPVVDPAAPAAADPGATIDPAAPAADPAAPAADPAAPAADPAAGTDWAAVRTRIAGGDEKVLNRLSRYSTIDEAIKAGVEAQNKIASGEHKGAKVPDEKSTEAEIAAYREANGVPATAKDYKVELNDGLILGEADQPVADAFVEIAHKHNLPQSAVNDIISHQLAYQNQMVADQEAADDKSKVIAEETLMSAEVWGSESTMNINMINQMLDNAPTGVKEQLMSARLADGSLLGNDVDTLRWLSTTARTINPFATVTPGAGQSSAQHVAGEIEKLTKMMGDKTSEYWKGPNAEGNQKRFREMVDMQTLAKERARK